MNRLSIEKRVQILFTLCEGNSANATARQTGAPKVTILKLLAEVGTAVLDFSARGVSEPALHAHRMRRNWSFIQSKERRVPRDERGRGRGDAWTWTAISADAKLIPCWHVGARDAKPNLFLWRT